MNDLAIIDGHVHFVRPEHGPRLLADLRHTGVRQFAIQVIGRDYGDPDGEHQAMAIELKRQMPGEVFVFGGLDYREGRLPFDEQLRALMAGGCDGLKMLTGKPDRRKKLGLPLDGAELQPMLQLAEESGFPVLWHVGDPPEFWCERTTPLWARRRGWWYDATHPTKAQIDREIAAVFRRHPRLNLILPHFFFLADRLDDAARLLDEHPSYSLDLAPGVEMFHHFTARRDAARAFFIKYAQRIIFGTDFGMAFGWSPDRGMMIRRFLETDEAFDVPDDPAMSPDERPPLRGLALPREVLQLIYAENFRRKVAAAPRPLRDVT